MKRKKTTYFLHCDPSETVVETKHKLHALSDVPVDQQRLILLPAHSVLDDNRTLADQKVNSLWIKPSQSIRFLYFVATNTVEIGFEPFFLAFLFLTRFGFRFCELNLTPA